ncbi:MAG: hypothetical protein ACXVEF_40510 [Polyangiales bacterium]
MYRSLVPSLGSLVVVFAVSSVACIGTADGSDPAADEETGDERESESVSTSPGVNGGACYLSPYNCKLRVNGGNRIMHADGSLDWGVDDAMLLDGNGDPLGMATNSTLKFNYGQMRMFHGKHYVYAMTTTTKSSGWFPLASVKSNDVLAGRVGNVDAHRSGLGKMACYEIRDDMDETLAEKKVVYDTTASPGPAGEAAGDYLARVRANGKRSANLAFNVPGSGLGGPAIDHFPAGTKFQRLDVPTTSGAPSIDIKLWSQDSSGHFRKPAGELKFVYGYVVTKPGDVRTGWIPYPALRTSSGCH